MSHLKRGWYWGRQEFAEKILKLAHKQVNKGKSRSYRRTPQKLEHGEKRAEELVRVGLKITGLKESDLGGLKGSDPRKAVLANLVWQKTTVSQDWIARRMHMKSAANVSQLLNRMDAGTTQAKPPAALRAYIQKQSHFK